MNLTIRDSQSLLFLIDIYRCMMWIWSANSSGLHEITLVCDGVGVALVFYVVCFVLLIVVWYFFPWRCCLFPTYWVLSGFCLANVSTYLLANCYWSKVIYFVCLLVFEAVGITCSFWIWLDFGVQHLCHSSFIKCVSLYARDANKYSIFDYRAVVPRIEYQNDT